MSIPGWSDASLIQTMRESDQDVGQHRQWWQGMNNGMSKSWLMQDGHDTTNTRYSVVDGAPWSFVYECKESSLPQEALDAVYLFSQHSMLNLRGAMVPTASLVPRIESVDMRNKWKIVGVWKKRSGAQKPSTSSTGAPAEEELDDEDEEDDSGRLSRIRRRQTSVPPPSQPPTAASAGGGIHDMDLGECMPPLAGGSAEGCDLENIPPVRIEAWMVKVFHYPSDTRITGDTTVLRKMFCILTVTPVRNLNLAEYLRHSIVENTQVMLCSSFSEIITF